MNRNDPTPGDPVPTDPLDAATSARLARLREIRVDTAAFDAKVKARLPRRSASVWTINPLTHGAWALRAVAAVLVVGVVGFLLMLATSAGPVQASTRWLAQVHDTAVAGHDNSTLVHSIEEARAALQRKWPEAPSVPQASDLHVMSCCVHEIGKQQMAVITFQVDNTPVSLALASADQIHAPRGAAMQIEGRSYLVGSEQGVNMVMTRTAQGDWHCVMGRLPIERLAQVMMSLERE